MMCNGCGGEFDALAGTLSYGDIQRLDYDEGDAIRRSVRADYHKTLCPRCQHVMKQILLKSDL